MSRKRDALGRFSAGASGSALSQFGREDANFKRPRTVNSSMPGYPGSVGAFNPAGQGIPSAASLQAGYSSGVIDIGSNSTSSLPVQARPWSTKCAISDFSPGALLFVRKQVDQHVPYKSVADLATANWLLREARDTLAAHHGSTDADMGACSNDHKRRGWHGDRGWNYFGSLRNAYKQPGGLVTLMNVDVFGRTKCSNIWSRRLMTGDRVGIALVPFNITNYTEIAGPGSGSHNPATYVLSLNNDEQAKDNAKDTVTRSARELIMEPFKEGQVYSSFEFADDKKYTVWQWMPTVNGKLSAHVEKFFDANNLPDFVDHISIGCVSNALHSGKCVEPHMIRALLSTDSYTTLPQIELLIE